MQSLHRSHGLALKNVWIAERFHGENGGAPFLRDRRNPFQKRAKMRVHHVDWHLHGVEVKSVLVGSLKHAQMYAGIFVTCEADVADFTRLFRRLDGLDGPARREDNIRIVKANDLVELKEIDHIRLQTSQRLLNLSGSGVLISAIDLSHQEDFLPVAVA